MEILKSIKHNLASIGFRKDKGRYHTEQWLRTLQGFLAIVLQCLYLIYDANTVKEYMYSLFMTIVGILVYVAYLSTVLKTDKMFNFMDGIEEAINGRLKYPRSRAMYKKTDRLTEKIGKGIQLVIVYISVPGFVLPKGIYSLFMYFTTNLGRDAFELPIPTWFPFDWKNPIGYSLAIFLQLRIVKIPLGYISAFISLGGGSFLFSLSIAEDNQCDLNSINESIHFGRFREQILEQFNEFVRFTNLKRLLSQFSDVYQVVLTMLFLGCTGAICLAMLMIQIDLVQFTDERNTVVLLESIFCGIWAINLVFVWCEFGQKLSNEYEEIENAVNELDWYLLPCDIQRMLPIILIYSQEPLIIEFFGSLACSREQFKKVINAGYRYFMVLREFYN